MVQITISGCGEFERAEANVVQSFIIDAVGLVCILYQLMDRQSGVVGLHHGVRHLRGGHHAEGVHDAVRVLFTDLADEQRAHA